jgi:hypothetical protein
MSDHRPLFFNLIEILFKHRLNLFRHRVNGKLLFYCRSKRTTRTHSASRWRYSYRAGR